MGRKPYKRRALTTDDIRLLNGEDATEDPESAVDHSPSSDHKANQISGEISRWSNEIDQWLAGRKIADQKTDGQRVTIVTWPDYQRRTFLAR